MIDNVHPTRTVHVGTRVVEIDELLAPLIETLWGAGLDTWTCCQDAGESNVSWVERLPHMADYVERRRGWAFVDFPIDDGLRFLDLVAQGGPRDAFYLRTAHWAAPDAWDVKIKPMDRALFEPAQPSSFGLRLLQVCFPVTDLPELEARLARSLAGDPVPPGPIDRSSLNQD
ncbi:hypothetical protein [Actinoplanes utahensis]|uniref:Uncharacterized protein n=1 Tax=Actinoplanes utahensis TaxID=1869 RepID=A0A0A6X2J2_ACTUT|nr:hypothetical protein [Actinoplanes utahensis]KHD74287.1 hypothetical protein MB27_29715 [Actinoplanes utahensis]GIF31577.1 hypothetical protein Aut01nite_45630 [Actinoplanes utahensis]